MMNWLIVLSLVMTVPRDASSDGNTIVILYSNPNQVLVIQGNGYETAFPIGVGTPSQVSLKNGEIWVYDIETHKLTSYTIEGSIIEEYQTPFQPGEVRELRFIGDTLCFLDRSGLMWFINQGSWTDITLQGCENPLDFYPVNGKIMVLDRIHSGFFSARMELKVFDMNGNLLESHQLPNSLKYGVDLYPLPSANQFLITDEFNPRVFQVTEQGDSVHTFTFETSGGISFVSTGPGEIWLLNINSLSLIPVESPTKVEDKRTSSPLPLRISSRPGQLEMWWNGGRVKLFDISGRRVFEQSINMQHAILNLNAGVYLLVYKNRDLTIKRKVVVLPKSIRNQQP